MPTTRRRAAQAEIDRFMRAGIQRLEETCPELCGPDGALVESAFADELLEAWIVWAADLQPDLEALAVALQLPLDPNCWLELVPGGADRLWHLEGCHGSVPVGGTLGAYTLRQALWGARRDLQLPLRRT